MTGTNEVRERRTRRKFSKEFKAEVVDLVHTSGQSVGSVARRMDLTEAAVRGWVRQAPSLEVSVATILVMDRCAKAPGGAVWTCPIPRVSPRGSRGGTPELS